MAFSAASTVAAGVDLALSPPLAAVVAADRGFGQGLAGASPSLLGQEARNAGGDFEVERIADGVYAAIRTEPVGFAVDANVVFIINEDDVMVVDTNLTPGSAKQTLGALRKLTSKPVRYVVNTHWHDDHIMGNQVYRDAFPGVEFIAHAETRAYLPTKGESARKQQLEGAARSGTTLRGLLEKNKNLGGGALTEEEHASYASDIKIIERYVGEDTGVPIVLPTLTIVDRLTLYRGNRAIEIRHLGRGHTAGDIVVHLPQEGVLISGDLVVRPIPLIGSNQSYIADWAVTLEKLRALRPGIIVPGHGKVMRDDGYVRLMASLMASVKQQAEAAVARGETLEQARKSVNLDEFRKLFAGDSAVRKTLFSNYVEYPAVEAAFNEASPKPAAKPAESPAEKP